ncbi:PEP-CTERM sorting domain-containing protein [Roseiconus lacunae]|uniref:PEP-CTERM sorting domain-containing protein n=1 Tax=Roseiconus lacunae TaxID=2605694 RepID=A0ABT7PH16_9BACT|nr:PEP-CTERM sorting domain-containing protein [Roseiconus lacunae]MDM4015521.1 PEP-CTERM sorting domain-containing protein [Roseiconus lacunae]
MKLSPHLPLAALAWATLTLPASAGVMHDQNVTPDVIFGSGNVNGSFTVDRNNGVELGMRGKLRHNASGAPENTFNSNGDGTFSFNAGVAPTQSSPTPEWSVEWSINTNFDGTSGWNLNDLTYELGVDSNPTSATTFSTFDPIFGANGSAGSRVQWDHAIGNNLTGNGDGTSIPNASNDEPGYADLIDQNNVAQQSWKAHWYGISGFDPTIDGTYDFYLAAFDDTTEVARTQIQIIVGAGGAVVPEPGTMLSFAIIGLIGCGPMSRRRR